MAPMVPQLLALLVVGSMRLSAEAGGPADLTEVVLSITEAIGAERSVEDPYETPLTVRDIPYYYERLAPLPVPETPALVVPGRRLRAFFGLP